jgi:hypothetical protein
MSISAANGLILMGGSVVKIKAVLTIYGAISKTNFVPKWFLRLG